MKTTSRNILAAVTLITFLATNSGLSNVSAQQRIPICKPGVEQIYYVDSGQSVTEVHPGSNGGNGYQLNILGRQVDKYTLLKEPYMSSVSLVSANGGQAKWQVFFNPNMGRLLSSVRMIAGECTGRIVQEYPLTENVRLLDQ